MRGSPEDDWRVQVGADELANACFLSTRSVQYALDSLERKHKFLTVREGASRRKSIYRLEWMRFSSMSPNGAPTEPRETNGSGPDPDGQLLHPRGEVSAPPEPADGQLLQPRGEVSAPPEQPNLDGLGGQHFADLFPRTRTDFDFDLIDMNDQSIIQIVKADLNDFDPGIVAEAGEMLLSYVSNPDLCQVRKLGPCPPPLLSEFLAVAPWRDLRLLLYDLRGQRQQVRSYAFFATYAAQKILRIPPEVFAKARAAKARAALSSLPGKRQAKKTTGYALDSGSPNSLWFAPEQFWGLGDACLGSWMSGD